MRARSVALQKDVHCTNIRLSDMQGAFIRSQLETGSVLWTSLIVGLVGVVLGMVFRAPAVIAAAAAAVACGAVAGAALSWSAWTVALSSLVLAVAAETGYLAGLALRQVWLSLVR
jgi:hypothetical protein